MEIKKLITGTIIICYGFTAGSQAPKFSEKCTAACCAEKKPDKIPDSKFNQQELMELPAKKKVIACKLTSPELQQRKDEVIAVLKGKILERQELKNGFRFKFAGNDQALDELILFIKSERACCDFFNFDLSIMDSESHIWLAITGPEGAKEFIKMEMEL